MDLATTTAAAIERGPSLIAAVWRLLRTEGVVRDEAGPVDVGELALRDAHVLAAMVFRARLVDEPEVEVRCSNCDATWNVKPSSAVEPGPFVDDELHDPELDAPFDFDKAHRIPSIFTPSGRASTIRLAPRTLAQAEGLYRDDGRAVPLSKAMILALGITAIGAEKRTAAIVRAIARAGDEALTQIGEHWEVAHYPERLVADVYCSACGARETVLAPGERAFDAVAAAVPLSEDDAAPGRAGFPSLEEFEVEAERARRVVYAARGIRNVPLIVDDGVAACDDGGEPLLGGYLPPGSSGPTVAEDLPEIRLYYRTFQSEYRRDPTFDTVREIRETIDHEAEHHLYFLQGHDPMDAEERAVIARDRARMVGKKELARRERGGVLRALFPLLVLLAVLSVLRFCQE